MAEPQKPQEPTPTAPEGKVASREKKAGKLYGKQERGSA